MGDSEFGARLRAWRQAQPWTILKTANHVKVNPSTIFRIEQGLSKASEETRKKIAKRIPELADGAANDTAPATGTKG